MSDEIETAGGLRRRVVRSGAFLFGRQLFALGLGLVGVLLITRLIGPDRFGAYAAAIGVYLYLQNFGQVGIGVYLVRGADIESRDFEVAWSLLLGLALAILAGLEGSLGWIAGWVHVPGFAPLLRVLALMLPFQMVAVAPTSKLERRLEYRSVATIEMTTQLLFYVIAVPAALLGAGAWALVAGWCGQQTVSSVWYHLRARHLPRLAWRGTTVREIVGYALGFSAAAWIWQLRMLINPLIVGHFLGANAVGQIGIAIRTVDMLGFAKAVAWRLSVSALARIQNEPAKLCRAITEGMQLQTLGVAPVLLGFSVLGGWLVTYLFGAQWQPVLAVYPYLALGSLTNILFNMHASILFIFRKNLTMAAFHGLHVACFALVVFLAIGRYGLIAYGWGEIGGLAAYALLYFAVQRVAPEPDYRVTALWWVGTSIGLFWRELGVWALAAPLIALLWPVSLRQLARFGDLVLRRRQPGSA